MRRLRLLLILVGLATAAHATNAPVLFFSDLIAGPASGNTDTTFSATGGVYVTLYGNFLDSPTAVQLNGSSCLTTISTPTAWMWYERMVVKLGTECATGNFTVTTAAGTSNGIAFTVRAGNIFYVKTTGSDAAAGTFAAPWQTVLHARDTIAAGDTVYGENGTGSTVDDGTGWDTCFLLDANAGTAGNSKAMIAYPGATVTIGNSAANGCGLGIRSKGTGSNHWVFGELQLPGSSVAIDAYDDQDWRIVGNFVTCPNAGTDSQAGCMDPGGDGSANTFNYMIYGNNINHAATNNTPGSVTTLYHGVYLSEFHHQVDFGWNTIAFVMGGRCFQLNVNTGPGDYDIKIHDNVIHDCPEDGIVSTTVDPSKGAVLIYNNVIYNAGQGPNPVDGGGAWNCINAQGWSNTGVTGESGNYQIYNNTLYGCGTNASPDDGFGETGIFLWTPGNTSTKGTILTNNILYATVAASNYFATDGTPAGISGANNNFFGNGTPPTGSSITGSTNSNPGFVSTTTPDFHLALISSPMNGTGSTSLVPTLDHDGLTRPSPPSKGAFEFQASSSATPPTCSPTPGTYSGTQSVTLTNSNGGTTVACYTTNGTTPATAGNGTSCTTGSIYSVPISVPTTETINAIAGTSTLADSTVTSCAYTITASQAATPTFNPGAGSYNGIQQVAISTITAGAILCYTENGATPITNGAAGCTVGKLYGGTIPISTPLTLNAVAGGMGLTDSAVGSAVYAVNVPGGPGGGFFADLIFP